MIKPDDLLRKVRNVVRDSVHTIDEYVELATKLVGANTETTPNLLNTFRYQPNYQLIRRRIMEEFARAFEGADRYNLPQKIRHEIEQYQESLGGAAISVSFRDFRRRMPDFSINGNTPRWSASTIKIPVMIEVYRGIDKKELHLDDTLEVDHKYTLEPYDKVSTLNQGERIPVCDLLEYMIIASDNEATNMLADRVGVENINLTMQELGATRTMMAHLLAPGAPRFYAEWNPEGSNLITADDLTLLMKQIYGNTAASMESCKLMRDTLEKGGNGIVGSFLPPSTRIGNKIGMIADPSSGDDILDIGVINGDYAVAILCNRIGYKRIQGEQIQICTPREVQRALRYWNLFVKVLDLFHAYVPTPVYFNVEARPVPYYQLSQAPEVIGTVSKVIYDVYYTGTLKLPSQK